MGERQLERRICRTLPDVLGAERDVYADRHTLVVGSGYSAATTVAALAELREQSPQTRIIWSVRHERETPVRRIPDDRLAARDAVAAAANAAVASGDVTLIPGVFFDAFAV